MNARSPFEVYWEGDSKAGIPSMLLVSIEQFVNRLTLQDQCAIAGLLNSNARRAHPCCLTRL